MDPAAETLEFWFEFLKIDAHVAVAPYAQLFQQLLDPASEFRCNRSGANAVLMRWTDLLNKQPHGAGDLRWSEVESRVAEVGSALQAFEHQVPCLVLVGPADEPDPVLERATACLQSLLADTPNLTVTRGERVMQQYAVERVRDRVSDRFGHVPFTSDAMTALGSAAARWYAATTREPVKLVAADGDHTLWAGVVAEDGVEGIRIGDGHAALQRSLVEQAENGRLLCLLSKNQEADVHRLFQSRADMPLRWSHLVARRIDWNPKPDNLKRLLSELELGPDGVVFLDDSPVECAQMRACCPAVRTIRVPADPRELAAFVEHLWLFDQASVTDEDRNRTRMYADSLSRSQLRGTADSLQSFIDSLELVVTIEQPSASDLPRLAQLSQRTNQFNASLARCDAHRIAGDAGHGFHRMVRASDRFGDYGVVGQVRARIEAGCLAIDLFMLSCRALGRGIEHRMIAAAGRHALSVGLDEVAVMFRRGERNAPAATFLEAQFGLPEPTNDDALWFRLPAGVAAQVHFDALAVSPEVPGMEASDSQPPPSRAVGTGGDEAAQIGMRYERIAHTLTTAAKINEAIARRVRRRDELASGYVAPAPGIEREIASIWQEVLRVDEVGSRDRFQDLGGKSLHLVKVHGLLLERLGVDADITTLFQHPTVSTLATYLAGHQSNTVSDAARARGSSIRAAHARAGRRRAGASP